MDELKNSFNKSYVVSLITGIDQNLISKDINVSELKILAMTIFYVTLVDKNYSREQLESLVSNVERLKNPRTQA